MKPVITLLLCALALRLAAIGPYQPGDTVYVWAVSGLSLRESASLKSTKLDVIPYGTALVLQNWSGQHDIKVEVLPKNKIGDTDIPALQLRGDFAQVSYKGKTGYLFDGYLSKLPAFQVLQAKNQGAAQREDFTDWATRNFGLLKKTQKGAFEYGSSFSIKWIFGNGILQDVWGEKDGNTRILLPDVSMEEAYLLFNFMTDYEHTVKIESMNPDESRWHFSIIQPDEWYFYSSICSYTVRYMPREKTALITSQCSC
jgi:hypothetical protein